jgi:rRNA maturation protein Nop10
MSDEKCPLCGSESFYVKDPGDPYEIYEFDLKDGKIVFNSDTDESEIPEVQGETETRH